MKNYIFLITLFFNSLLFGSEVNYTFKDNYTLDKILKDKVWKQLVYYKNGVSEVNDKSFFLNKNGKQDSKAELISTINAYNIKDINDKSPICKFPARYFYLKKYLNFPNYSEVNTNCDNLLNWKGLNDTNSLSVIMVSGYISNPASTFGHSFLKLNNGKQGELFDFSMNYGALVPNNENTMLYILKGLTGGYQAGFSDKYFYNQDLTYSNTEFRDMWDYKLNLTDEDTKFILLHLWEIVGKKFDYFFLNKNCGYRVSELINLVSEKNIVNEDSLWFLPIETFYDLEVINNVHGEPIIDKVKFIPSKKRAFDYKYNLLPDTLKPIVKDLINNKTLLTSPYFKLNENYKIKVLDFLLLFYRNLIITNPKNKIYPEKLKNILMERFNYKSSKTPKMNIKYVKSPATNTKPIDLKIGLGFNEIDKEHFSISFSPYYHSFLGISNIESDELITLNTKISFNKEKVFLDAFDFIKIKKIKFEDSNLLNEFDYSWKLNIGTKRILTRDKESDYMHFANFGVGKALEFKNFNFYFMNDFILNNNNEYLRITPNINFDIKLDKYKINLEYGYNMDVFTSNKEDYTNLNIQYNTNKNTNFAYNLKSENNNLKHFINYKIDF